MTVFLGILLALAVLTVVVFFHELGHFVVAKLFRVTVEEFGIGIPPRLCRLFRDRSGTEYTINVFPIGGFVRMRGESATIETDTDAGNFAHHPLREQMCIVLAGVAMNFLFAGVIFAGLFMYGVHPLGISPEMVGDHGSRLVPSFEDARREGIIETDGIVMTPLTGSVAEHAGLHAGDILLALDGQTLSTSRAAVARISSAQSSITFSVRRGSGATLQTLDIPVTPVHGRIGAVLAYHVTGIHEDRLYRYPPLQAVGVGFREVYDESVLTLRILGSLAGSILLPSAPAERTEAISHLSGPIGVGDIFVHLVDYHAGFGIICVLAAMISINLGVFNLLPFPALDGGRFAFMVLHALTESTVRRRVLAANIESIVHVTGFAALILLSIFIAYRDILRIFFP